jgi:hypothetical protein
MTFSLNHYENIYDFHIRRECHDENKNVNCKYRAVDGCCFYPIIKLPGYSRLSSSSPHQQHMQHVSDLTGITFQEDEISIISPLSTPREEPNGSAVQVDQQSLTASQCLSYCNQQSPSKLMATCEESVSINLLEDSTNSTSNNASNPDYDASESGSQNVDDDSDDRDLGQGKTLTFRPNKTPLHQRTRKEGLMQFHNLTSFKVAKPQPLKLF